MAQVLFVGSHSSFTRCQTEIKQTGSRSGLVPPPLTLPLTHELCSVCWVIVQGAMNSEKESAGDLTSSNIRGYASSMVLVLLMTYQ